MGASAPSPAAESGRATRLLADVQEARQVERTATPTACSKRVARPLTLPCRGAVGTRGIQGDEGRPARETACRPSGHRAGVPRSAHVEASASTVSPQATVGETVARARGGEHLQRKGGHVTITALTQSAPRKSINPPSIAGGFRFMSFKNPRSVDFLFAAQVPLCCAAPADLPQIVAPQSC